MYTLPQADLKAVFDEAKSIWPRDKNFFITGGTGFFGRWLVECISLLENKLNSNNTFYILSRNDSETNFEKIPVLQQPCFKIVRGELSSVVLPAVEFDYVIHAATDVNAAKSNSGQLEIFESVVLGTKNLLEQLSQQKISKFLTVSSGAVYGPHDEAVEENAECMIALEQISSAYGEGKRCAEWLTFAHGITYGLPVNCVRCFAFVGPYADPSMAIMNFLNAKLKKEPVFVQSPNTVRSYMYPTDLVCGLFLILFRAGSQKTYNLGSDRQVTLGQLAELIGGSIELNLNNSAASISNLGGNFYVPNIKKLRTELNFQPKVELDAAISKTLHWMTNEKL